MTSLNKDVYLITGRDVSDHFNGHHNVTTGCVDHPQTENLLRRMLLYSWTQFRYAISMLRKNPSIERWVFFIGGETLLVPMIVARITGKPTILVFPGSAVKTCQAHSDPLMTLSQILSKFCCLLCNHVVVYSNSNIHDYNLSSFQNKIRIASEHIISDDFRPTVAFGERELIIGYLGRFSPEKGILQFVQSLPSIINRIPKIEVMLIGDGPMRNDIMDYLQKKGIDDRVKFLGWTSREKLPELLNQLRLLVIPSFTEGLPNAMLEAMACGVAILANPVGSIPDFIIENDNGFLMDSNEPDVITERIVDLLAEMEPIRSVAQNGRESMIKRFTLDAQMERWNEILD